MFKIFLFLYWYTFSHHQGPSFLQGTSCDHFLLSRLHDELYCIEIQYFYAFQSVFGIKLNCYFWHANFLPYSSILTHREPKGTRNLTWQHSIIFLLFLWIPNYQKVTVRRKFFAAFGNTFRINTIKIIFKLVRKYLYNFFNLRKLILNDMIRYLILLLSFLDFPQKVNFMLDLIGFYSFYYRVFFSSKNFLDFGGFVRPKTKVKYAITNQLQDYFWLFKT